MLRLKKHNLDLLEKSIEMRKYKIANIRNQTRTYKICVSMKNKVKDLHETLSKFTKEKENLDLILSSQKPYLSKTELGFKFGITHNKEVNKKKVNFFVHSPRHQDSWKRHMHTSNNSTYH